jgi:AraC family transcriptional regulator
MAPWFIILVMNLPNAAPEIGLPIHAGLATYPPGAEYGPRELRDYEFVWMIEGDAEYRWGGSSYPAPANSIVLCRPGALDGFSWDRRRRTRHGFFHFQIVSVPDDWPEPSQWPVVRELPVENILGPLFQHLITWHDRQPEFQSKLAVAIILSLFMSGNLGVGRIERDVWPAAVEVVCTLIYKSLEDEPTKQFTLPELASAASVSPEHLCRLFRQHVGRGPMETVRLVRLDYAAGLLSRSNYSVGEVSELCGFANPYHFSRAFKDAFGQSPSAARQTWSVSVNSKALAALNFLPRLKQKDQR